MTDTPFSSTKVTQIEDSEIELKSVAARFMEEANRVVDMNGTVDPRPFEERIVLQRFPLDKASRVIFSMHNLCQYRVTWPRKIKVCFVSQQVK